MVHRHDDFPTLSDPSEADINDPSPQLSHPEAEIDLKVDNRDSDVASPTTTSSSAENEIAPSLGSDHAVLQRSHALFLLG